MTPRKPTLLGYLIWILPAASLAATMPYEVRAQQTAGTPTQGRPSTPQAAPATAAGRGGDQRQGPRQDWLWWQEDAVKKELGLTDQQSRSIDRLYQQREREMRLVAEEYSTQNDELRKLRRELTAPIDVFRLQALRVQGLGNEVFVSGAVMRYRMDSVLTPEQRAKMPGIRDRHFGRTGPAPSGPRPTPTPWWQDEAVKKELVLSEQQVRKIDQLFQQREKDMKLIAAEYEKQDRELDKMRREYVATPEVLRLQVIRAQLLRNELDISRAVMLYRMSLAMSADQRAKLQGISERQMGRGRGGGAVK